MSFGEEGAQAEDEKEEEEEEEGLDRGLGRINWSCHLLC